MAFTWLLNPWSFDLCFFGLKDILSAFSKGKLTESELSFALLKHTNDRQLNGDWHINNWWFVIRPRKHLEGLKVLTQWFADGKITEDELLIGLDEYWYSFNPYRALSRIKYGINGYTPTNRRTIELVDTDFNCFDD